MIFDDSPFDSGQADNCKPAIHQVLLVRERSIAGDKDVESVVFRGLQESAVFQAIPSFVTNREHIVVTQSMAQAVIQILIKQDFHEPDRRR